MNSSHTSRISPLAICDAVLGALCRSLHVWPDIRLLSGAALLLGPVAYPWCFICLAHAIR